MLGYPPGSARDRARATALGGFGGRRAAYGTLAGVLCVLLVLLVYAVHHGRATFVIVVVGLSHKTAPISVREHLALPEQDIPAFLHAARAATRWSAKR